ncbi:hypothetical protein ACIBH1_18125 [Nonomuraea sp. NPDC050663]|uniref:hypothetical protein n=1 Tax=Nonomuraea sp. NPDC050663 TaxID=3364370 RepID=UPI0037BB8646
MSFTGSVAAELIKLRTLRSTWWILAMAVAAALLVTALAAPTVIGRWGPDRSPDHAALGVLTLSFFGLSLSQLVLGVLGVLTITSEHASGMIDVTWSSTPSRPLVLLAKAVVLVMASGVSFLAISVPGYVFGRLLAARHDPSWLPGDGWPMLGSAALVLVMTPLLGLALGALFRSGAGALAALLSITFLVPLVMLLTVPAPWGERVATGFPLPAQLQLLDQAPPILPAAGAFGVCLAYLLVPLAVALVVTHRRSRF